MKHEIIALSINNDNRTDIQLLFQISQHNNKELFKAERNKTITITQLQ